MDNESEIIGYNITFAFPDYLAGILDSKLYFTILVPVRIYLQPAFTNPFSVVGVD